MAPRAYPALALLVLGAFVRGDRLKERLHGDGLFDTKSVVSESDRVAEFSRRYESWPPPALTTHELPSYTSAMARREAEIMQIQDSQERWDAWMFMAQARLMRNFTVPQWEVIDAPKDIHAELLANLRTGMRSRPRRERDGDRNAHSGVHGPNEPDFVDQEHLNYKVLDALKPLHEKWAGVALEPTSVYGVRLYRDGATLADHLDVPETHVISSILHVDSSVTAPFPIEIEDATGAYAAVDLKPGQMMFYESAKCFHRRSVPMRGDYYGSVFLHYRPKEWTFSRYEIRLAAPPPRGSFASRHATRSSGRGRGDAAGRDADHPKTRYEDFDAASVYCSRPPQLQGIASSCTSAQGTSLCVMQDRSRRFSPSATGPAADGVATCVSRPRTSPRRGPRLRRGCSVETSRGDAADATWIFRGDKWRALYSRGSPFRKMTSIGTLAMVPAPVKTRS